MANVAARVIRPWPIVAPPLLVLGFMTGSGDFTEIEEAVVADAQ